MFIYVFYYCYDWWPYLEWANTLYAQKSRIFQNRDYIFLLRHIHLQTRNASIYCCSPVSKSIYMSEYVSIIVVINLHSFYAPILHHRRMMWASMKTFMKTSITLMCTNLNPECNFDILSRKLTRNSHVTIRLATSASGQCQILWWLAPNMRYFFIRLVSSNVFLFFLFSSARIVDLSHQTVYNHDGPDYTVNSRWTLNENGKLWRTSV